MNSQSKCVNPKCKGFQTQPMNREQWIKSCPICGVVVAYMKDEPKRLRTAQTIQRVRVRLRRRIK